MKIAIFGGTFDPFHVGHLAITQKAALEYDKVIIVPTTCNYYRSDKRYLFTFDEKCRIIQEMICNIKGDVSIDTIERDQNSKWRTINTIEYFKSKFPNDELYYILGQDSYDNFSTWFRYDDILRLCTLVTVIRSTDVISGYIPTLTLNIGDQFIETSASDVRNKLIEEVMDMYLSDKSWYAMNT